MIGKGDNMANNAISNVEPLGDRLLVRPDEKEKATSSGILLPPGSQEEPQQGTIVATGNDCDPLVIGDVILHSRYGTTKVKIEGEEFLLLRVADVLARINPKKFKK
jgi:chaperonin GroES